MIGLLVFDAFAVPTQVGLVLMAVGCGVVGASALGKVALRVIWACLAPWRHRPVRGALPAPSALPASPPPQTDQRLPVQFLAERMLEIRPAGALGDLVRVGSRRLQAQWSSDKALHAAGGIVFGDVMAGGRLLDRVLITSAGIFCVVVAPKRWSMVDIERAALDSVALADTIGLSRDDVPAVLLVGDSSEEPRVWFTAGGQGAILVGSATFPRWLASLPVRLDASTLGALHAKAVDALSNAETPRYAQRRFG